MIPGRLAKARRGELGCPVPTGYVWQDAANRARLEAKRARAASLGAGRAGPARLAAQVQLDEEYHRFVSRQPSAVSRQPSARSTAEPTAASCQLRAVSLWVQGGAHS